MRDYQPRSPTGDVVEPLLQHLDAETWRSHDYDSNENDRVAKTAKDSKMLMASFIAMVFVGLGNKVMQKVQTEPMKNYPYFLNLYTTFIFIPASFVYVIPMLMMGKLSEERKSVPQFKYLVMGFLDGFSSIMQTFAVTKIASGSLLILLSQAAIPISMLISRILLKASYTRVQYLGAALVMGGIALVLAPRLTQTDAGGDDPAAAAAQQQDAAAVALWSAVMILSCVPMTLSSVFKEKALSDVDLDPIYLNGYIALYQFLFCIPAAVPAAWAIGLPLDQVPSNCWNGLRCYLGVNSVTTGEASLRDDCAMAPAYVNTYLAFNIVYNILMILILKYGSANLLFLALTVMVPLSNVAFSIPWMPGSQPITVNDGAGLGVIMIGLLVYRFTPALLSTCS